MHSEKIKKFTQKRREAEKAGGEDRILAQHGKGKLTARERIDLLLDEGSFVELGALTTHHYYEFDMQKRKFFGDGVITGYGTINGKQIFVFAYDFTVLGGTLSAMGSKKITKVMDRALKVGQDGQRRMLHRLRRRQSPLLATSRSSFTPTATVNLEPTSDVPREAIRGQGLQWIVRHQPT